MSVANSVKAPEVTSTEGLWERVMARLRASFSEAVFSSWFKSLKMERIHTKEKIIFISVSTDFLVTQVKNPLYFPTLQRLISEEFGLDIKIQVSSRSLRGSELAYIGASPKAEEKAAASNTKSSRSRPDLQLMAHALMKQADVNTIKFVAHLVAWYSDITVDELVGNTPTVKNIIRPRSLVIYLSKEVLGKDFFEIVNYFYDLDSRTAESIFGRLQVTRLKNPLLDAEIRLYTEVIEGCRNWKPVPPS